MAIDDALRTNLESLKKDFSKKLTKEQRRELYAVAYNRLRDVMLAAGGEYYEDVNEAYRKLRGDYVVRREEPTRLLEAVADGRSLPIVFDPKVGHKYANAAVWRRELGTRGIESTFLEGLTSLGGIVVVTGFLGKHLKVEELPKEYRQIHAYDRSLVRSIEGEMAPEEVRFIIAAMPAGFAPQELLTGDERHHLEEDELENKKNPGDWRIFRTFLFPQGIRRAKKAQTNALETDH